MPVTVRRGVNFTCLIFEVGAVLSVSATSTSAQAPRARDSAGVHIVENAARAKAPIAFTLGPIPLADVGGIKDNPDDELDPHGGYLNLVRLSDGGTVVNDNVKLRYYDRAGRQLHVVGRSGQGPGEFRQIASICRTRGDTIVVSDPGNSRVTVFDKNVGVVRQIPIGRVELPMDGCLDDGTWIIAQPGVQPGTRKLVRYRLDGSIAAELGDVWGGTFSIFMVVSPTFVASGDRVYFGDSRASEVKIRDESGRLTGIIRTADPIAKTTAAEREAMQPAFYPARGSDPEVLARAAERLRTTPRPAEWPSYERIAVDPDGRLWIEDYPKTFKEPSVWTGFDRSGRMLGKLSIPAANKPGDARLVNFARGGVLVRRWDDDGAQHLTVYPLVPVKR